MDMPMKHQWGALPEGETHHPLVKAGTYAHTPNGRGLVLWIHQDHQWEFGRRVHTQTWVGVQLACGSNRTYPLEDIRP